MPHKQQLVKLEQVQVRSSAVAHLIRGADDAEAPTNARMMLDYFSFGSYVLHSEQLDKESLRCLLQGCEADALAVVCQVTDGDSASMIEMLAVSGELDSKLSRVVSLAVTWCSTLLTAKMLRSLMRRILNLPVTIFGNN